MYFWSNISKTDTNNWITYEIYTYVVKLMFLTFLLNVWKMCGTYTSYNTSNQTLV